MINSFIAAIVALFFWGKTTKDIEEKTQLASWWRTIIYGVLTFAVAVFYVKTCQVATLTHTINALTYKGNYDEKGGTRDTIHKIDIYNRFSTGITENTFKNQLNNESRQLLERNEAGGMHIGLRILHKEGDTIKTNPEYSHIKTKNGYISLNSVSHAYEVQYLTNFIPSLIPFFISKNEVKEGISDSTMAYYKTIDSDYNSYSGGKFARIATRNLDGGDDTIRIEKFNAYINDILFTDTMSNAGYYDVKYDTENNYINRLGFFTAADISQYTCAFKINSDIYIKELFVGYDLPIEINPYDSCMSVSSKSFIVRGDFLNKEIVNQADVDYYVFHVKFPTLANMQLIRSLILTTLLTALVSLSLLNLFYRIRKHFVDFRENHVTEISKERVAGFRIKMYCLLVLILLFISYVTWRILNDNPFYIDIDTADFLYSHYVLILIGVIVVFTIIIYLLFRKVYFINKKKK